MAQVEASTILALRAAHAEETNGSVLSRVLAPIAKFSVCKRQPVATAEALEVLGGNGYVLDASPLARLYRQAPLNSVWEGSGTVVCLDVLRALRGNDSEATLAALRSEVSAPCALTRLPETS